MQAISRDTAKQIVLALDGFYKPELAIFELICTTDITEWAKQICKDAQEAGDESITPKVAIDIATLEYLVNHRQQPDFIDPTWDKRCIIGIEHKKSGSGNPTWYLTVGGESKQLYIRQSNKDIWIEHYPELETMNLGDSAEKVDIICYTMPDPEKPNDFMQTVKVMPGGVLKFPEVSASAQRKASAAAELTGHDEWQYIDLETTGLNDDDEIVSVAIIQSNGDLHDFLIKPNIPEKLNRVGKNGKTASDIHGITPEMLQAVPTFPEQYERLKTALHDKIVASYSDYDIKTLNRVCAMHNLDPIIPSKHINLMLPIAKYIGEKGFKAGEYKWQPLSDAYQTIIGQELEGAHNSMIDTLALQKIVQEIISQSLNDIPF